MDSPRDASLLVAALAYVARGWLVFPLAPRQKTPLTDHGFKDATADSAVVSSWWTTWPDANVGVATGAVSGIDVVDLDVAKGDTPAGRTTLAALEQEHGEFNTLSAATGSGGVHLYFAHRDGVGCSAGRLPGIDVRASGGYVVAPPSVHPSGGVYRWLDEVEAERIDPAPWPDWLFGLLAKPRPSAPSTGFRSPPLPARCPGTVYGLAALRRASAELAATAEGARNHTLNAAAFSLARLCAAGHLRIEDVVASLVVAADVNGYLAEVGERTVRVVIDLGVAAGLEAGPRGPTLPWAKREAQR